jgi:GT2 family glycosyltransferase
MTRLFVIVPVYGNWQDTIDCVGLLEQQSTRDFRLVVADDGSPEPPPEAIRRFPIVEYLRGDNLGFAGNCNRAARHALAEGATHLLFLNNDTQFSRDFIAGWLETIGKMPDCFISPLIFWFSRPSEVWCSGGLFTVWAPFVRFRKNFPSAARVDLICGCALLAPSAAWNALGGFDERYVTYFEDFDLLMRAKALGFRAYVVPDAALRVRHKISGSFGAGGVWKRQYRLITSGLIFIRSHYSGWRKYFCVALTFIHAGAAVVLNLPQFPRPAFLFHSFADGLRASIRQPDGPADSLR